jgi:hypothetical protein
VLRVFTGIFLAGHDSSSSHLAVRFGTKLDIANNDATVLRIKKLVAIRVDGNELK